MNELKPRIKYPIEKKISENRTVKFGKLGALYQQAIYFRLLKLGLPTVMQSIIAILKNSETFDAVKSQLDTDISKLLEQIDDNQIYEKMTGILDKLSESDFETIKNALLSQTQVIQQGNGIVLDSGMKEPPRVYNVSEQGDFEDCFDGENFADFFSVLVEACKVYIVPLLVSAISKKR